jgi:peroxiredoxin
MDRSAQQPPTPAQAPLQPGTRAPDFALHTTPDQSVTLGELVAGGPVVLVFYPADWSPVCGDQLVLYNELLQDFRQHGASIAGISVDGVWCHLAYARDRKLRFPLLSDFEPKGAVARAYGAYRAKEGVAERALFVVDRQGVIRWSYLSPIGVNPGADGILRALEEMSSAPSSTAKEGSSHEHADRPAVRP